MPDPPQPAAALDTEPDDAATGRAAGSPPCPPARPSTSARLAIPDYDGLSASHVVNRLAGLSASRARGGAALRAANRGRKTILSKVAQLQAG